MSEFGNQDILMAGTAQRKRTDSDFVSFTAHMMAVIRAQETQRHDRLFNDPFAAQLAATEAFAIVEHRLTPQDKAYVAVRTRFFDDFLLEVVAKVEAPQVVILASGMDARAFRLPWPPGTQVYELDCREVLESKAVILKDVPPTCKHYEIAADLRQPWQHLLLGQGYRDNFPSVWLLEGLLMYLTEPEVHNLLQAISNLAVAGSQLGLDLINTKSVEYEPYRGHFRSGFDNPEALLAEYGWEAEVIQPGEEGANFGRYLHQLPPRDIPNVERAFLIKAKKKG